MNYHSSRRRRHLTALATLMALSPVAAAADGGARLAPIGAANPQPDAVQHLISLVAESCYERGDDAKALRGWAESSRWSPATDAQLKTVPENEFASVVGGWTVSSEHGATAIIQSQLRSPLRGHVCSVTTRLPDAALHGDAKSAFQIRFGTSIAEEHDSPSQHIDRFWIARGREPPVKASMVFTPSHSMITIRMIHGQVRPLGS